MSIHERLDRTVDRTLSRPRTGTSNTQVFANIKNGLFVGAAIAAPVAQRAVTAAGVPGVDLLSNLVNAIFQVAQQISFNKRQSLRLAQEARKTFDALKDVLIKKGDALDRDPTFIAAVERFAFTLRIIDDKLKEIARENLFGHLLRYKDIADELTDLQRRLMIAVSPQLTVQVDMYSAILQSEQSRKEDRDQLLRELERIKSDSSAMMDLMTERSGKLDQESIDALQTLLHKIDHQPEKVLPAIRDFAEVATQTLKTQTNVDLPRRPPWLVSSKDFQKCEEFGRGRFSTMRKAIWRKSSMEVALKELEDREKLEGLFEDIVRWRELEHPCLHAFTAAQPIKLPRFFIYKFMPNGNVIDYLRANPKADTGLLLLHVALGMEYLHRHSVVHGNLNCHNILIDDQGMALVADFGISSHFPVKHEMMKPLVTEDEPRRWHTVNITGSLHWSAPETFELGAASTSSDVWSFAITAYELLTGGTNPIRQFPEEDVWAELAGGYRPPKPRSKPIADHIWTTITQCWDIDPATRPQFPSIVIALSPSANLDEHTLKMLNELLDVHSSFEFLYDPFPSIRQAFQTILPTATPTHLSLSPEQVANLSYLLRMVPLYPPMALDALEERAILPCYHNLMQNAESIPKDLFTKACTSLAALLHDSYALTQTSPSIVSALLKVLTSRVLRSPEEADAASLGAISALISVSDSISVRQALDPRFTDALVRFLNKTGPTVEAALEACGALGKHPQVLTQGDFSKLGPLLSTPLLSSVGGTRSVALATLGQLLQQESTREMLRDSIDLDSIVSLWTGWQANPQSQSSDITWASVILLNAPVSKNMGMLMHLVKLPLLPAFHAAACSALGRIGRQLDSEEKLAVTSEHDVIPLMASLLPSCPASIRHHYHEIIAAYSCSSDLPQVLTSLRDSDPAAQEVALRRLLGMVLTMDENAKTEQLLTTAFTDAVKAILTNVDKASTSWTAADLTLDTLIAMSEETSPDFLDEASTCFVEADIPQSLTHVCELASSVSPTVDKALRVISLLSAANDDAKIAFLSNPTFLARAASMIECAKAPSSIRNICCAILQHLLSIEDREEEDEHAILEANLTVPLVTHVRATEAGIDPVASARVLSLLLLIFRPDDWESSRADSAPSLALGALDEQCSRSLKDADDVFSSRYYALGEYIRHPEPRMKQLGLKLTLALLKGSTDQRRAITSLNGFRTEIEKIQKQAPIKSSSVSTSVESDGTERSEVDLKVLAGDILERWKTRRRG